MVSGTQQAAVHNVGYHKVYFQWVLYLLTHIHTQGLSHVNNRGTFAAVRYWGWCISAVDYGKQKHIVSPFLINRKTSRHAVKTPHLTQPNKFKSQTPTSKMTLIVFLHVKGPISGLQIMWKRMMQTIIVKCFKSYTHTSRTNMKNPGKITYGIIVKYNKAHPFVMQSSGPTKCHTMEGVLTSCSLDLSLCRQRAHSDVLESGTVVQAAAKKILCKRICQTAC